MKCEFCSENLFCYIISVYDILTKNHDYMHICDKCLGDVRLQSGTTRIFDDRSHQRNVNW